MFVAKTFHGLERVLAAELKELGAKNIVPLSRAVSFEGNEGLLYSSNLHLRTAISILKPISSFEADGPNDLYEQARRIKWSDLFHHKQTFSITHAVSSRYFKHSQYASLRLKDAICDHFRDFSGYRPSVDTENPDIRINLHIYEEKVKVSLDSSGKPLFKRSYRKRQTEAPLNEVLAAGIIKLTGWECKSHFIDPMCGSGTLPTEAAMMALDIAPGLLRDNFCFLHWPGFDSHLWKGMLADARRRRKRECEVNIIGADIDRDALAVAKANASFIRANSLRFAARDFFTDFEQPPPHSAGGRNVVVFNPPYGLRLANEDLDDFYRRIGTALKNRFTGCDVWMLSPIHDALKEVHLKPSAKATLFNGALECRLQKFEMYAGSRRAEREEAPDDSPEDDTPSPSQRVSPTASPRVIYS